MLPLQEKKLQKKFIAFRKEVLKISQTEMAARLKVSPGAVGSWERRNSEPSGRLLWGLIKEFGLNPDWLFYDLGDPITKSTTVANDHTIVTQELSVTIDIGQLKVPVSALASLQPEIHKLSQHLEAIKAGLAASGMPP